MLAYLRGDTARLDGDVDVTEVLGRVRESGVAWIHGRLAAAGDLTTPTLEAYRAAVDSFADDLAAACQRERGLMPNYIAVDFYNLGDLTGAVDTLNGVHR